MRSVRLLLYGDTNRLAPNRLPLNRFARWRMEQAWKEQARLTWLAVGEPPFSGRVRLTFTLYRARKLDEDNAHSSLALKYVVDGLKGLAFPDDSIRWVEYGHIRQEPAWQYRGKSAAVEVLIEECVGPARLEPEQAPPEAMPTPGAGLAPSQGREEKTNDRDQVAVRRRAAHG